MHHVAILNNSLFLQKILSGEKAIESRWLKNRSTPWYKIREGDIIFFKLSGKPVTLSSKVQDVKYILLNEGIDKLFRIYGHDIGFDDISQMRAYARGKRYLVLVFLKDVKKVAPFNIDKKGFGIMSAWITVQNIKNIKIP